MIQNQLSPFTLVPRLFIAPLSTLLSSPQFLFHINGAHWRFKLQMILLQPLVCLSFDCLPVYYWSFTRIFKSLKSFPRLSSLGRSHIFRPHIVKSIARPSSPSPFSADAPPLASTPPLPKSQPSIAESGNVKRTVNLTCLSFSLCFILFSHHHFTHHSCLLHLSCLLIFTFLHLYFPQVPRGRGWPAVLTLPLYLCWVVLTLMLSVTPWLLPLLPPFHVPLPLIPLLFPPLFYSPLFTLSPLSLLLLLLLRSAPVSQVHQRASQIISCQCLF